MLGSQQTRTSLVRKFEPNPVANEAVSFLVPVINTRERLPKGEKAPFLSLGSWS